MGKNCFECHDVREQMAGGGMEFRPCLERHHEIFPLVFAFSSPTTGVYLGVERRGGL